MIKENELRIGNWVKGPMDEFMQVNILGSFTYPDYTHATGVGVFGQNGFEPIPLTPEILEKCGFELYDSDVDEDYPEFIYQGYRKWKNKHLYYSAGNTPEGNWQFAISRQLSEPVRQIDIDNDCFVLRELNYLHQLQNLYFSLTGEELNYTP